MCLPMDAQVVNGEGEGRVHVADKNAGFVLRAVRMNRVAVAEAVRVVVANDSNPLIPDTNHVARMAIAARFRETLDGAP